jgi:FKBP-type peptidyl-prolyl cis-trans isomerase FklB
MTKLSIALTTILALGLASADALFAQQTPSSTTPPSGAAPAASAPAKPAASAKSATTGQGSTTPKSGTTTGAKRPASAVSPLKTPKEKASYAIGMRFGSDIGTRLKTDGVDVDAASLARGIRDAVAGNKSLLTDDESKAVLTALATDLRAKQQVKMAAIAAVNKKTGDAFLAENKTKEGVVTLPSGLQYKILKAGDGPKPAATDTVVCDYRGTLLDGKEFDSSYKRGKPLEIPVSGVIKGWTEAMLLMPVGSKWQLFLPADLAYGNQEMGPDIKPGSTLIFEVELHSIAPPAPKAEAPKTDAPKAEPPKADAPKTNPPKPDTPKADPPKPNSLR